jgi:hypothetical protein
MIALKDPAIVQLGRITFGTPDREKTSISGPSVFSRTTDRIG